MSDTDADHPWVMADDLSKETDRDFILLAGPIDFDAERRLRQKVKSQKSHKNVMLFLTTMGGDADAAFRMARCLQGKYDRVEVFVHTFCKSAGTLLATGAHGIVMSEGAEFGPLDVQLRKPDEIDERTSGLAATQAIASLRASAYTAFERFFVQLRRRTRISSRIAADVATNLTVGLFAPIYEQFEPFRLGENDRSIKVAEEYVKRLIKKSENLEDGTLPDLIAGYPSHEFVIDFDEAKQFFKNIRPPEPRELVLAEYMEGLSLHKALNSPEEGSEDENTIVWFFSGLNDSVASASNADGESECAGDGGSASGGSGSDSSES